MCCLQSTARSQMALHANTSLFQLTVVSTDVAAAPPAHSPQLRLHTTWCWARKKTKLPAHYARLCRGEQSSPSLNGEFRCTPPSLPYLPRYTVRRHLMPSSPRSYPNWGSGSHEHPEKGGTRDVSFPSFLAAGAPPKCLPGFQQPVGAKVLAERTHPPSSISPGWMLSFAISGHALHLLLSLHCLDRYRPGIRGWHSLQGIATKIGVERLTARRVLCFLDPSLNEVQVSWPQPCDSRADKRQTMCSRPMDSRSLSGRPLSFRSRTLVAAALASIAL